MVTVISILFDVDNSLVPIFSKLYVVLNVIKFINPIQLIIFSSKKIYYMYILTDIVQQGII